MELHSSIKILLAAALATRFITAGADFDGGDRWQGVQSFMDKGHFGVIASIESGPADNDGTVIGGVLGGIVGHPMKSQCAEDAATLASAARPVRVRPDIDASKEPPGAYFIRVRFDDSGYQTVTQADLGELRVGDSVQIDRDGLRRCR
jgi:hypothetical protein